MHEIGRLTKFLLKIYMSFQLFSQILVIAEINKLFKLME